MGYFGIFFWNFPSSQSEFPFQKFDELHLIVIETHRLRLCQDTGDGSFEIRLGSLSPRSVLGSEPVDALEI